MGALAKLQARIHELEKLNEQLSVWKPREKLSRTLELSNLVSRFNALAEAKVSIKFELAPISGTVSLIMNAMMLYEVSLLHAARTGCEFYRNNKDNAEGAAVMAEFRNALLTREADPVEITLTVDGGAATPVLDAEAALLAELPARPPREVTVRVTQPRAAEALAAPRAALVIVEPDKCRLFPLDARALATPVAEFLMTALFGEMDAGDERDTLLRELRQTIVVSAAHVKNADATPVGRARRTQLITTFRSGKFGLASLKLVRTDATLADATDAAAPLVVLHAIARVDAPCATHVTLTLRDHAMDVQLSDALMPHVVFPSHFRSC